MIVKCPYCGNPVVVNGFGRRSLNIAVTKVCDALRLRRNVTTAASELRCSRAYVYRILKANGLQLEDVINSTPKRFILPAKPHAKQATIPKISERVRGSPLVDPVTMFKNPLSLSTGIQVNRIDRHVDT